MILHKVSEGKLETENQPILIKHGYKKIYKELNGAFNNMKYTYSHNISLSILHIKLFKQRR